MTFHVGQRVKYVGPDCSVKAAACGNVAPVPGAEYTVREVGFVQISLGACENAIRLCEIVNPPCAWYGGVFELWMNAKYFRPITERKTDISIFTEMLLPQGVEADA